ncbi:DUF4147 domain-containing protein [Granulicella sp. WH15]|uniref:glycerate kinase type-2 family protein n=1 Tax=Granulicella sp. WH15 TaxID=2602070 RepID=UPI0013668BF4|nr:DUF4147 domain-containing protein [Granulicella sp. WH15]QHN02252.1 DUF4147 domain-containing protein [Granulicella sp. WH15]
MSLPLVARSILSGTLERVRIPDVLPRRVLYRDGVLHLGDLAYPMRSFRRVILIVIGKAAVPMCETVLPILDGAFEPGQTLAGVVVGTVPLPTPDPRIQFFRGGHPHPDAASRQAADAILQLLASADEATLVLFLISGGGSAMLEKPLAPEVSLEETAQFHAALVRSGLPITQMNALRKHFSRVKGGRLALAAAPATQCTLLISDVPADALDVISSGPSLPDLSTVAECRELIASRPDGLGLPPSVLAFFQTPHLEETPKPDHPAFLNAAWVALLSSEDLCSNASSLATDSGFTVAIDNSCDDLDYRIAARYLIDRLIALRAEHPKVCLISAGELSVQLGTSHGSGGRNQQFVLECARIIAEEKLSITVLSAGSDGIDGHSPAAGAVADETTWARAIALGINPSEALENFNSFPLFESLGDAIITGPTGNNLRDLRILLSD